MGKSAESWRAARTAWAIFSIGVLGLAGGAAVAHPPERPAGTLDVRFGSGGVVLTPEVGLTSSLANLVVQEDGKTVTAGVSLLPDAFALTLVRYRRDGALDPTFGVAGTAITTFTIAPTLAGIALQRDGKIVAAGSIPASDGGEMILLARYRHDGQLDETFGTAGLVFSEFGAGTLTRAAAVTLQPDGRIVVVGLTTAGAAPPGSHNMLARYDRDGALDGTFGVGGLVVSDFGDATSQILNAVTIARDGKIVAVGSAKHSTGFAGSLARFNRDGSIDATFGTGGSIVRQLGGQTTFTSVALQPGGRILVAADGPADPTSTLATGIIARFHADGTPDASFGASGLVVLPVPASGFVSIIDVIAVDRCGGIVALGEQSESQEALLLLRFDRDGSPDPAFGTGGETMTTLDGLDLQAHALALAPDGDIVVGGLAFLIANPSTSSFVVARYEEGEERGCERGRSFPRDGRDED